MGAVIVLFPQQRIPCVQGEAQPYPTRNGIFQPWVWCEGRQEFCATSLESPKLGTAASTLITTITINCREILGCGIVYLGIFLTRPQTVLSNSVFHLYSLIFLFIFSFTSKQSSGLGVVLPLEGAWVVFNGADVGLEP